MEFIADSTEQIYVRPAKDVPLDMLRELALSRSVRAALERCSCTSRGFGRSSRPVARVGSTAMDRGDFGIR